MRVEGGLRERTGYGTGLLGMEGVGLLVCYVRLFGLVWFVCLVWFVWFGLFVRFSPVCQFVGLLSSFVSLFGSFLT